MLHIVFIVFLLCYQYSFGNTVQSNETKGNRNGTLKAQTITMKEIPKTNPKQTIITAKGDVFLKGEDFEITTQELSINNVSKVANLPIKSKTTYFNLKDNTKSFIFADKINGYLQNKEFDGENIFLISDAASINAKKANAKKPILHFENATFSTCKMLEVEIGKPCKIPWYGVAKTLDFNEETKILKVKHLVIKIHKVPLFYYPSAKFDLNGEKDGFQNAILVNANGQQGVRINYLKRTTNFGKFLISPEFYFNKGTGNVKNTRGSNISLLHTLDRKIKNYNTKDKTEFKIAPNVVTGVSTSANANNDTQKSTRYYINHKGALFNDTSSIQTNILHASDRSFRQLYNFAFENYLESSVVYDRYKNNSLTSVNAYNYAPITEDNKNIIPSIISSVEHTKFLDKKILKGNAQIKTQLLNFHRMDGLSGTRGYAIFEGIKYIRKNGYEMKISPSTSVLHYLYQNSGNSQSSVYSNATRGLVDLNLTFSKTFLQNVSNVVVQTKPILFLDYTLSHTNGKVSNEDSVANYVQDSNVFAKSKFNGLDLVDEGLKIAYGIDVNAKDLKNHKYKILLAQRYNMKTGPSNYVGNVAFDAQKFSTGLRFIMDNKTNKMLSQTAHFTVRPVSFFEYTLSHFFIDKSLQQYDNFSIPTIENITHSVKFNKNHHNIFVTLIQNPRFISSANTEQTSKKNVGFITGIGYDSDCLFYKIGIQKNLLFNGKENININTIIFEMKLVI